MSVTWVRDIHSRYEVSSKEHLLQIIGGWSPPNHLSSSYIQTADIDLVGETVIPIGTEDEPFTGVFDGGNFSISNWNYTGGNLTYNGFFGYCLEATLMNIVLAGVWYLDTSAASQDQFSGLLCGRIRGESRTVYTNVYNVSTDFDVGTCFISGRTNNGAGTIIGSTSFVTLEGISMGGVISVCTSSSNLGGVVGATGFSTVVMVRNIATFETPMKGSGVGGVVCQSSISNISYIMNAMTGDLGVTTDDGSIGGVINTLYTLQTNADVVVNSMRGNIVGSNAGGLIHTIKSIYGTGNFGTSTRFMNYMQGNVTNGFCIQTANYDRFESARPSVINSVVAMKGEVDALGIGVKSRFMADSSFGLTTGGVTRDPVVWAITGYTYHNEFDLPYVPFRSHDNGGNYHNWEFIFPNVSGNSKYSKYSDVVISTNPTLSIPLKIVFDIPQTNSTEYVSYFKRESAEGFVHDSLAVLSSNGSIYDTNDIRVYPPPAPLEVTMYTNLADITWLPVDGASWYKVTYSQDDGIDIPVTPMTTLTHTTLFDVQPGVSYEVKLYSDLDTVNPARTEMASSPEASDESLKELFSRINNDLTLLPRSSVRSIGREITSSLTHKSTVKTRRGEALFVENSGNMALNKAKEIVLTSFDKSAGGGQNISVTLPDASTESISFDETNETVGVESGEYGIGTYFVLGEYKVSVEELGG